MTHFPRAGFRRRIASWVYDALIALAIYMFVGLILSGVFNLVFSMGYIDPEGYATGSEFFASSVLFKSILNIVSLSSVAYFFIFFWARAGQTLGMKAWRLRVQNIDGSLISKSTGAKRLIPTLLGLGNITILIDRKNKLSLQDRLTNTEVVVLSLEANKGRL